MPVSSRSENLYLAGRSVSRREMLLRASGGFATMALAALMAGCQRESPPASQRAPAGRAMVRPRRPIRSVIFLYMEGGPSHIDTFDPKPRLAKEHGQLMKLALPPLFSHRTVLQSPFKFARYGESGAAVSELFPHVAQHVDDLCIVRSMVSEHSEHTTANYFMNTGAAMRGRPSMGAWVDYGLGSSNSDLPGYMLLASNLQPVGGRDFLGNGFLPARHQPTHLRPDEVPMANLKPCEPLPELQRSKLALVEQFNRAASEHYGGGDPWEAMVGSYELAYRMQGVLPEIIQVHQESEATRKLYGIFEEPTHQFGVQCLWARRLVERGVRFVQLIPPDPAPGGGTFDRWDQHSDLVEGHRSNALQVDRPIAGLLTDLRSRGLLDETLIIWGGEFGRTPMCEVRPGRMVGRDHNPHGFTMWLAGGGVRGGMVFGETDEYGYHAVANPVTVHDLHATVLHLLGIDHTQLTYHYGGRDYRLTDIFGRVVHEILA